MKAEGGDEVKAEVGAWSSRERVQGQQYDEDGRKLTLTGDELNSCLEEIDGRKRRSCYIVGVYLSRNASSCRQAPKVNL